MKKKEENSDEKKTAAATRVVKPAAYVRAAQLHLEKGNSSAANAVIQQAVAYYPEDPMIVSYYGCLQAIAHTRSRNGIEHCRKAIALMKRQAPAGEELLYPVLFLNLSRAYSAAGKTKEAVEAAYDGLAYDRGNTELLKELRRLGFRKEPAIPFLDRSNPINKYIGIILNRIRKIKPGNS